MEINEKQWEVLVKRLDRIEQSQNDDRRDIDKISITLATVSEQNEKILGMLNRTQRKVGEAVNDAVAETLQPLSDKMDVFVDKKVIKVDTEKVEKLNLLQRFYKTVKSWKR